jgi:hypothetical protein
VRVPLTADAELFTRAVELGREVVWASTYGERCADSDAGRPQGDIALSAGQNPKNVDGIPHTDKDMPATITHTSDDESAEADDVLLVGASRFQPVPAAVWRYDVGGKPVNRPGWWRGSDLARRLEPCLHLGSSTPRLVPVRCGCTRTGCVITMTRSWPLASTWASC